MVKTEKYKIEDFKIDIKYIDRNGNQQIRETYNEQKVNDFLQNIQYTTTELIPKQSKIYILDKKISQSKLRDSGYIIVQNIDKADYIIFNNLETYHTRFYDYNPILNTTKNRYLNTFTVKDTSKLEKLIYCYNENYKLINTKEFYRNLYKYEGNLELVKTLDNLLKSRNDENIKMAMEIMSNANWEENEIYLQQLFSDHFNNSIRGHSYKTSISFKGFLDSLNFRYGYLNLDTANNYLSLCKNQEHFEYVFNKFKEDFLEELKELHMRYNLILDNATISINKNQDYEDVNFIEENNINFVTN